ncbi:MAG: hypothetical protein ACHQEM_03965 [Chitinophagales bacterium]
MGTKLNLPSGKKAEFECKSVQHKKSSLFGGTETWFSYEGKIIDSQGNSSAFRTLRKSNGKWPDDLNSSDEVGDKLTLEEFRREITRHGL